MLVATIQDKKETSLLSLSIHLTLYRRLEREMNRQIS